MPMPGEENNAVDYIYSADNLLYSEWKKKFLLLPRKSTFSKKRIWLEFAYTRTRKMKVNPPQFPINHLNRREWATADELMYHKLTGLDV